MTGAPRRIIATFTPQVWVSDNAMEVDPEGDTEWDATTGFNALPDDYQQALLAEIEKAGSAIDDYDLLKDDPNAPEWARNWHGPFDIRLTQQVEAPQNWTIEVRVEFHGTRTDADAEAGRLERITNGRITAVFDEQWSEV